MKGRVYRHETKAFILILYDVIVGIIRIVYTPTQRHKWYLSTNLVILLIWKTVLFKNDELKY